MTSILTLLVALRVIVWVAQAQHYTTGGGWGTHAGALGGGEEHGVVEYIRYGHTCDTGRGEERDGTG